MTGQESFDGHPEQMSEKSSNTKENNKSKGVFKGDETGKSFEVSLKSLIS